MSLDFNPRFLGYSHEVSKLINTDKPLSVTCVLITEFSLNLKRPINRALFSLVRIYEDFCNTL